MATTVDELAQRGSEGQIEQMRSSLSKLEDALDDMAASQRSSRTFETQLESRLNEFNHSLDNLLASPVAIEAKLDPLLSKLELLHAEVVQARTENREFENTPMAKRFDALASLVERGQNQSAPDMVPIDARLDKIQHQLNTLNAMSAETIAENGRQPSIGPTLLKRAEFGKKDNLQEIAGIGPKLERSLNKLGVYYYWQIAAWNKRDIRAVDANLEAFRGRIERDDWVRQAKLLRKHAHAAQPPSGREMAQKLN